MLNLGLARAKINHKKIRLLDLGCGSGRLISALYSQGLLRDVELVVGVDISRARVRRLVDSFPFVEGIISDVSHIKELPNDYFNVIICSQVIEHIEEDNLLIQEIYRLLENRGLAYLSSVLKNSHGVYFYWRNGTFRLEPSHIREYASIEEFVRLIQTSPFHIIKTLKYQTMFSVIDFIIRTLMNLNLLTLDPKFFQKHKSLQKLRSLKIPIVGYKHIAVLISKE